MSVLRCKLRVDSVRQTKGPGGVTVSEEVSLIAAPGKCKENRELLQRIPASALLLKICDPTKFDRLHVGDDYYVDLTKAPMPIPPPPPATEPEKAK